MVDILMPQMGESIAEGTVTKWLKNVGDRVQRDEPLLEISTDKVDAEIPAPAAGVLGEIRIAAGHTVPVLSVLGVLVDEAQVPLAPELASEGTVRLRTPLPVSAPPAEARPAPSPVPSVPADPAPVAPATREKPHSEMALDELRRTRSSPVVRRIAAEHHIDIRQITGSGIGGRVTRQDILSHLDARPSGAAAPAAAAPVAPPAPPEEKERLVVPSTLPFVTAAPIAATPAPPLPSVTVAPPPSAPPAPTPATGSDSRTQVVPMSPIRKKTAEHMLLSRRTSAHVTTVFEIDMTRVDRLRTEHRGAYEERGVKLTYLPFIVKAAVEALAAYPVLNASVDGDSIVYHRDVNIGVAVALDWGLIVPVVRNAEEKSLLGLARTMNDLAARARAKKLKIEEVQGGTFTLTNSGVFGGLFATPIIHQPQVAILSVGSIEKRPVVRNDAIAIRTMAYLGLSFDHRIVDGADADRFMALLKDTLQDFDEAKL